MREWSVEELAAHLGLPFRGDGAVRISSAAALDQAGSGDLSFVGGPKVFSAGMASRAACLIAPGDFPVEQDRAAITSDQPRAHFAEALGLLYPVRPVTPGIEPSASIAESASIDATAEIGPFVSVGSNARIGAGCRIGMGSSIGDSVSLGEGCTLHPHVTIYERVSMGARCIVHSGAVLGADGFGFEFAGGKYRKVPQVGTVEIGDDVEIGANTCIDRATLGATVIGDGSKLDNMVHIAHNCRIGRHVVIAAQTGFAGGVTVGDYAVIGGQVGVGDKARIEAKAVIGSGAGILTSKIVRAGEPVWGTPARPLSRYLDQLATVARLSRKRGGN